MQRSKQPKHKSSSTTTSHRLFTTKPRRTAQTKRRQSHTKTTTPSPIPVLSKKAFSTNNNNTMSTKPLVPKLQPGTPNPYFTSRTVICLVRTYADHAAELGNAIPPHPIIFLKPPSCLIMEHELRNKIEVPETCTNLHHEIELGVIIGKYGRDIVAADAMDYVQGYFLGLDMTARELQGEAKKAGLPWTLSKGHDSFGPISPPIPKELIPNPANLRLQLQVNGVEKQNEVTSKLLFSVPQLIAYISKFMALSPGDLIFTGTPAGVGPVKTGDVITCQLSQADNQQVMTEMSFPVISRQLQSDSVGLRDGAYRAKL